MIVKVCGITTVADGQHAVTVGASALGFNFYKESPRYVRPADAATLIDRLKGKYLRVGVFVNATAADFAEEALLARLDVVQLHGSLPDRLPEGVALWRALPAGSPARPDQRFSAYLLDAPATSGGQYGGTGRTFEWSLAAGFPGPVILAGGLTADNVGEAIATAKPVGVDACSRLESSPGRKDPALVTAFVQRASAALRLAAFDESTLTTTATS